MVLAILLSVMFGFRPAFSEGFGDAPTMKTVFIDPGHGGDDTGARGPGGTTEKDITLKIGRILSEKLSLNSRIQLSRTDDRRLEIWEISGIANEMKADLFISLHIGSSFRYRNSGFTLYHYDVPERHGFNPEYVSERSVDLLDVADQWRGAQLKHLSKSKQLSKFICIRLDQFPEVPRQVAGADIMVLAGVDMPAILIEFSCLPNLEEENKLNDIHYLTRVAEGIAAGVTDFLTGRPPISSMDLRQ